MTGLKVVLAVVLRDYNIRSAYEEWDHLGLRRAKGPKAVNGERAYQVVLGSAQPSDDMRCRVVRADRKGSD